MFNFHSKSPWCRHYSLLHPFKDHDYQVRSRELKPCALTTGYKRASSQQLPISERFIHVIFLPMPPVCFLFSQPTAQALRSTDSSIHPAFILSSLDLVCIKHRHLNTSLSYSHKPFRLKKYHLLSVKLPNQASSSTDKFS